MQESVEIENVLTIQCKYSCSVV